MSLRALQNLPMTRLARFVAVLAVAVAAGHLAQTLAAQKGGVTPLAIADVVPTHIVQMSSGGQQDAALPRPDPKPHRLAQERAAPACPVNLALVALPQAMLWVSLTAPCHYGERIVLHQAGLVITGRVGANYTLTLPAFTADGTVAVLFADGTRVEQALPMPEVTSLRRFGVQWQGADAFVLHGMENGADFGQPGDVSAKNPAGAGFMTVVGDATVENPLLAQVYTYPVDTGVTPAIVLVAAVMPGTCGHDLLGEVLTSQGGQVQRTDLTLAMPDCAGVGDFLVLKNLASDMKIAAN